MILRPTLILSLLWLSLSGFGQVLDSKRSADWSVAGMAESKSEPTRLLNFLELGGYNDGIRSNDPIIRELFSNRSSIPTVLYFPPGTYHFTQALHLPNHFILRGAGADSTLLQFEMAEADHLIQIRGTATADTTFLIHDGYKDESFLLISQSELFQEGTYVQILDDDQLKITSSWALYSTGQLARITEVSGDTLFLNQALRRNFLRGQDARVVRFVPKTQVGIEQLSIRRLDATHSQTSNIFFEYAANSWVSCIESQYCNFAHVEISRSTHIEVSGSHFEEAFSFGGGGKAYGVMLHFASGACLVENNSFRTLRHAMILQAGANGNVLAYNYSTNPYWTGVNLPSNSAGDLVLHGNYPYANLLEGNVVQNIVIDASHGINGPFNTFFRNRAELFGLFMNNNPASDQQNFLGNEIPNTDYFYGNFLLSGDDHVAYANNVQGTLLPTPNVDLPEISLYQREGGDQMDQALIGFPNPLNANKIPAQIRYESHFSTACEVPPPPPILASEDQAFAEQSLFQIFPNPGRDRIQILVEKSMEQRIAQVELCNLAGQLLLQSRGELIDVRHLPKGMYLVRIRMQEGQTWTEKWMKE